MSSLLCIFSRIIVVKKSQVYFRKNLVLILKLLIEKAAEVPARDDKCPVKVTSNQNRVIKEKARKVFWVNFFTPKR